MSYNKNAWSPYPDAQGVFNKRVEDRIAQTVALGDTLEPKAKPTSAEPAYVLTPNK